MKFDQEYFSAGLYRMGTGSEKWDVCRAEHGADVLPMWVADMDFQSPPAVRQSLLARAAHPTYGYTEEPEGFRQALIDYWHRRHGLDFSPEAVTGLPCVVTGLKTAIRACTAPGDAVVLMSPVYGPFFFSVQQTGRVVADAPLLQGEDGSWSMNLPAVEQALQNGARLIMLCSPHNPVSRPWTAQELTELLQLANRWQAVIVSDEIHADFVYQPDVFVPLLSLQRERVLSLCAPSKTFNIAGLQCAHCVCDDEPLRKRFQGALEEGGVVSGNLFGMVAAQAAYSDGDAWLDGLLAYLDENRRLLARELPLALPEARLSPIRATYLAWLDLRAYAPDCEALRQRLAREKLVLTGGTFFGDSWEGFMRLNFACPSRMLLEGLERLKKAMTR